MKEIKYLTYEAYYLSQMEELIEEMMAALPYDHDLVDKALDLLNDYNEFEEAKLIIKKELSK